MVTLETVVCPPSPFSLSLIHFLLLLDPSMDSSLLFWVCRQSGILLTSTFIYNFYCRDQEESLLYISTRILARQSHFVLLLGMARHVRAGENLQLFSDYSFCGSPTMIKRGIDMVQCAFTQVNLQDRISADLTRRHFKLRCIYSKEERDLDHYHYTGPLSHFFSSFSNKSITSLIWFSSSLIQWPAAASPFLLKKFSQTQAFIIEYCLLAQTCLLAWKSWISYPPWTESRTGLACLRDHGLSTGWSDISQPKETETIRKLLHILEKSGCLEKEYANPAIIHCNSGHSTYWRLGLVLPCDHCIKDNFLQWELKSYASFSWSAARQLFKPDCQ